MLKLEEGLTYSNKSGKRLRTIVKVYFGTVFYIQHGGLMAVQKSKQTIFPQHVSTGDAHIDSGEVSESIIWCEAEGFNAWACRVVARPDDEHKDWLNKYYPEVNK